MSRSDLFNITIRKTLAHEGGYVNHPHDPGGATNYGISLRWLRQSGDLARGDIDGDGDLDADDIKNLTEEQATELYHEHFWLPIYDELPAVVAVKVFDMAVNMGPKMAHILLQRAINDIAPSVETRIIVDGVMGPKTVAGVKRSTGPQIMGAYRARLTKFYRDLAEQRPKSQKFLRGWLIRVAS